MSENQTSSEGSEVILWRAECPSTDDVTPWAPESGADVRFYGLPVFTVGMF